MSKRLALEPINLTDLDEPRARNQNPPSFSKAKSDFIRTEIGKPAFLDNGRPRGSTHRRQDLFDVQMRMIHGDAWVFTDTRLETKFNDLANRFDGENHENPSTQPLDADTIKNIVELVMQQRDKNCSEHMQNSSLLPE